ncbi:MAG: hypothetical protein EAZ42_05650 [Verrucomicrobia bacterium]|nr:MAG: hypothetical protein EAZ42_05650 [Verrucomicrobiota bacterium]
MSNSCKSPSSSERHHYDLPTGNPYGKSGEEKFLTLEDAYEKEFAAKSKPTSPISPKLNIP